jgi:hypothetical protein
MLVAIGTPRRRSGLLYDKHKACFGKDDPNVLVVQGATRQFNPTIDAAVIDAQRAADPAGAVSEWDGEFRTDICQLLSDDLIDGAVDHSRPLELPPAAGVVYRAFVDVGGSGASEFSVAIGHRDVARGKLVVDVVRSVSPPYNVIETVAAYSALLRQYRINNEICGDHYGGSWPSDVWRDQGIKYTVSRLTKSELYLSAASAFLRVIVNLPNMPRLVAQLRQLERRSRASGKDVVDSGKRADDLANVACGVLHELARRRGFLDETGWMDHAEEKLPGQSHHPVADRQAVRSWCEAIYVESGGRWWG